MQEAITLNTRNSKRLHNTIDEPVGVPRIIPAIIPDIQQIIEITAEEMTTPLKLLQSRIDVSAGKIIRAEIRRVPIIFIPITMVTAVRNAISIL